MNIVKLINRSGCMRKKLFSEIPFLEGPRLILKKLEDSDSISLDTLRKSERVYRYLPTFLFEKKYTDVHYVIKQLYDECFVEKESIILGIFLKNEVDDFCQLSFCGLAEFYGFRDEVHKISIGYRLLEERWGRGIATETVGLMIDYLCNQTDIEIITASTMVENKASANVLRKNEFTEVISSVPEDWGYEEDVLTTKWIR